MSSFLTPSSEASPVWPRIMRKESGASPHILSPSNFAPHACNRGFTSPNHLIFPLMAVEGSDPGIEDSGGDHYHEGDVGVGAESPAHPVPVGAWRVRSEERPVGKECRSR